VDTGFPKGNAANFESRTLSGRDARDFIVNLSGKRSKGNAWKFGLWRYCLPNDARAFPTPSALRCLIQKDCLTTEQ
jgi:hypothetical protein